MMRMRRRKSGLQEQKQIQAGFSAEEFEALRLQIKQIQTKVDILTLAMAQLGTRSFSGLRTLGVILYFLFLPLLWTKRALLLLNDWVKRLLVFLFLPFRWARRVWVYLKQPQSYWTGFYWLSFAWVLILDGGLKEVLIFLRHPRRLARSIGLLQQ